MLDDRGAKRREKFLGDVSLDVTDQVVDKPSRLLPTDPFLFGIALADFVQLKKGDTVIQNGANSGVGRAAS